MTGGAAAGVGPWKPLCFPFARGRQLFGAAVRRFRMRAKRLSGGFPLRPCVLAKEIRFASRIGFIQPCIGEWYEFRYRALIQAL